MGNNTIDSLPETNRDEKDRKRELLRRAKDVGLDGSATEDQLLEQEDKRNGPPPATMPPTELNRRARAIGLEDGATEEEVSAAEKEAREGKDRDEHQQRNRHKAEAKPAQKAGHKPEHARPDQEKRDKTLGEESAQGLE